LLLDSAVNFQPSPYDISHHISTQPMFKLCRVLFSLTKSVVVRIHKGERSRP